MVGQRTGSDVQMDVQMVPSTKVYRGITFGPMNFRVEKPARCRFCAPGSVELKLDRISLNVQDDMFMEGGTGSRSL